MFLSFISVLDLNSVCEQIVSHSVKYSNQIKLSEFSFYKKDKNENLFENQSLKTGEPGIKLMSSHKKNKPKYFSWQEARYKPSVCDFSVTSKKSDGILRSKIRCL